MSKSSLILGWLAGGALAAQSLASPSFSITGLAGTGVTANVSFSYQSLSDTAATLAVSITNTSSSSIGGFVTGFAFNVPTIAGVTFTTIAGDTDDSGAQSTTALGSPNESGWWSRYDVQGGIKTPNSAGDFDFGVLNQRQPNPFITGGVGNGSNVAIGETTLFTLGVTGAGLDDLSNSVFESFFMAELSTGGSAGAFAFGARFQGLTDGSSDFAVGTPPPPSVVPVPSAAFLALLGMGGVGIIARRVH